MKKLFLMFTAVLLALSLVGCGGDNGAQKSAETKKGTLKVGATPVPHAEILTIIKPILEKEKITLEIKEFSDYVQPNLAVNDKELDANFFQHLPYLENFTTEHKNVKLVSVAGIHVEPMGIYSKKIKKLDELIAGDIVSIPNDPTNGGRALILLGKAGLIKLKEGVSVTATVQDIVENPKNLKIQEVEAAQLPRTLDDVAISVINTNFAMQASLIPTKDSLFMEDKTSPYVNIVAVRKGDEERREIKALVKALQTKEVKDFINSKYNGAIVPTFDVK